MAAASLELVEHFERLHLHHLSAQHKTKDYCRKEFFRELARWKKAKKRRRGPVINRTYVEACLDRPNATCRYVIRIFHYSKPSQLEFANELRTLQTLSEKKVDFVPRVHTAFLCHDYGLLVQEKWGGGDILDFLLSQKEDQLDAVYQRARRQAIIMVTELHQLGLCYGRNAIDFRNVVVCRDPTCPDVLKADDGFHLGLQDWRGASEKTAAGAEQDRHQMEILFFELATLIRALRHRAELPAHLPYGLRNKAKQLREW